MMGGNLPKYAGCCGFEKVPKNDTATASELFI
jgi:hypothetical protein